MFCIENNTFCNRRKLLVHYFVEKKCKKVLYRVSFQYGVEMNQIKYRAIIQYGVLYDNINILNDLVNYLKS